MPPDEATTGNLSTTTPPTITTATTLGGLIPPAPPAAGQPAGTWTPEQQAAVTAMMTREKQQGHNAARIALAESLGCGVDDLDATVAASKAARDAASAAELEKMSEADRLRAEAEAEKLQAAADRATATSVLRETLTQAACVRAGTADPAVLVDLTKLVTVDADPHDRQAFDTAADAAVGEIKGRYPAMFTAAGTPAPPPSSTPVGAAPPPGTPPAPGGLNRGAQRAQAERAAQTPVQNLAPIPKRGGNPFD